MENVKLEGQDLINFALWIERRNYHHRLRMMQDDLIAYYIENRESIAQFVLPKHEPVFVGVGHDQAAELAFELALEVAKEASSGKVHMIGMVDHGPTTTLSESIAKDNSFEITARHLIDVEPIDIKLLERERGVVPPKFYKR